MPHSYPIPTTGNELRSAEIACVAVHPAYRKSNRGRQILDYLEDKAKAMGIQQLFILTTRTAHWFLEQGFSLPVSMNCPMPVRPYITINATPLFAKSHYKVTFCCRRYSSILHKLMQPVQKNTSILKTKP